MQVKYIIPVDVIAGAPGRHQRSSSNLSRFLGEPPEVPLVQALRQFTVSMAPLQGTTTSFQGLLNNSFAFWEDRWILCPVQRGYQAGYHWLSPSELTAMEGKVQW